MKVSLITGCLNGEKFIDRCFGSILSQTYNNLEVIFVDDGSTDGSLQLAESYKNKFKERGYSFIVIAQKNMGFYPQSGIKISTGKYITTLDIDDLLLPESIERRANMLENNPEMSAVRTNGLVVREGKQIESTELLNIEGYDSIDVFEDLLFARTTNIPGTYMVRADILFKYYPDRIVPMDRLTQNLQILLPVTYQREVGYIDEPLMQYMRHDEQCTADINDYETAKKLMRAFKEVRRKILQRMDLLTSDIESKLDKTYNILFLRLAYRHNAVNEFNSIFNKLNTPNFEERFLHASINKNRIKQFFMRVQNKMGLRKE
jgi:glycosyltransferase involved in cell wall biosynthesis